MKGLTIMFDFGMNLKNLRKSKGLTQEQAADLLNVSKQSISHWENNVTYPDISFLPALASFYGTTTDSLLGVDAETNAALRKQYFSERQKAHHAGDFPAAFALSQELYARFPNDLSVMNFMMIDSYLMGLHDTDGQRKHYLDMSISVSERFLKMTEDMEESCRCIQYIAACYKLLGNQEMAVSWMNRLPSLWSGIENAALKVLDGQDRTDSIQCSLEAVLHLIYRLITTYANDSITDARRRLTALKKIPDLFCLMFENEDYGFYHSFLSSVYEAMAKTCLELGSGDAISYVKKAAEHARACDASVPSKHTSVLFADMQIAPEKWTKAYQESRSEHLLNVLEAPEFEPIRKSAEWDQICAQLKESL